jgi:SAM-dependent methyltransferase
LSLDRSNVRGRSYARTTRLDGQRPVNLAHGLIAKWWSEFNDEFRPHEIPFFQRYIERSGEPALDVGCGTGRLLLPYLRAGLDVDGCDISEDMLAFCREKAVREGFSPNLFRQAMDELDPPRRYRTIFVCGSFGLGSTREQDFEALRRFRESLEPRGTLLLDVEVPYADPQVWRYWLRLERGALPEPRKPLKSRRRASDGTELVLSSRILDLDPLEQRMTRAMHAEQWRDGVLEAHEEHLLHSCEYFRNELLLMLERAGFTHVIVQGDHNDREARSDDNFLVFVARK